jgi:hypothetical protein
MNDEILDYLKKILARLDGVETRLDGVETRLDGVETRLGNIDGTLDNLKTEIGAQISNDAWQYTPPRWFGAHGRRAGKPHHTTGARRQMRDTVKKTYRLGSSEMVHTPGIVRWAINGYHFKEDRPALMNVLRGWNLPDPAIDALLSGKASYAVEGDVVVFTA